MPNNRSFDEMTIDELSQRNFDIEDSMTFDEYKTNELPVIEEIRRLGIYVDNPDQNNTAPVATFDHLENLLSTGTQATRSITDPGPNSFNKPEFANITRLTDTKRRMERGRNGYGGRTKKHLKKKQRKSVKKQRKTKRGKRGRSRKSRRYKK